MPVCMFFGTDIALVLGRVYGEFLRLGINRMFLLMLMRYSPFPIHVLCLKVQILHYCVWGSGDSNDDFI